MRGPGAHNGHTDALAGTATEPIEQHEAMHARSDQVTGLLRQLQWALLRWRGWRRCDAGGRGVARGRDSYDPLKDASSFREQARATYLKMAGALDQCINAYNAELPGGLSWLAKARLPSIAAAAIFDARCPPAGTGSHSAHGVAPMAGSQ
jgi:hypothetical protein